MIKDRRQLSDDGLLSVVVTIDEAHREVNCAPNIISRGFIYLKDHNKMVKDMQEIVIKSLDKYLEPDKKLNINGMKIEVTRQLKNYISQQTNRNPMIMPVIMVL